jgi:hypothetical protein
MKTLSKIIEFETAKLLKEKGFDEPCRWYYDGWAKKYVECLPLTAINELNGDIYIPTIAEVIDWMYEKHGIWLNVYEYKDHAADVNDDYVYRSNHTNLLEFKTPTEAYEKAIEYVLTNVI